MSYVISATRIQQEEFKDRLSKKTRRQWGRSTFEDGHQEEGQEDLGFYCESPESGAKRKRVKFRVG